MANSLITPEFKHQAHGTLSGFLRLPLPVDADQAGLLERLKDIPGRVAAVFQIATDATAT